MKGSQLAGAVSAKSGLLGLQGLFAEMLGDIVGVGLHWEVVSHCHQVNEV